MDSMEKNKKKSIKGDNKNDHIKIENEKDGNSGKSLFFFNNYIYKIFNFLYVFFI